MHPEIERRFDALEVRRKALVERARAMNPEDRTKRPANGCMAANEVIKHFALVEAGSVERVGKLGPKELQGKKPKTTFIFKVAVRNMHAGKQMKAPPGVIPTSMPELEPSAIEWENVRTQLRACFELVSSPEDPMQKFWLFGLMSAHDLLELYESHHDYHEKLFPQF